MGVHSFYRDVCSTQKEASGTPENIYIKHISDIYGKHSLISKNENVTVKLQGNIEVRALGLKLKMGQIGQRTSL